jgi:mono/diheme cytochrome c family protein
MNKRKQLRGADRGFKGLGSLGVLCQGRSLWRSAGALGIALWGLMIAGPARGAGNGGPEAFINRYCVNCHDSETQKGDRRLDDLPFAVGEDQAIAERWQEVLHQLQLGEMPPPKKTQPSDEERRAFLAWIEGQLARAQSAAQARGGRVVHRRLSRAEYRYTIQDVFGLSGDFDPTTAFPGDEEREGFRNNGAALRTSRHHLEQYVRAADAVLNYVYDLAEVSGRPKLEQWKDTAEQSRDLNEAFGLGVVRSEQAEGPAYIHLSHGLRNQELIYDSKLFLSRLGEVGVPHSGWYEVEVEATGANRHHPYGRDLMLGGMERLYGDLKGYYDESQPMRLGIGHQAEGLKGNGWRLVPPQIVYSTELPDTLYTTVRTRIWLDRGTVPYLSWIDGPPKGTRGNFISTKLHKYDSSVPKIEKHVWENLALRAERDKLYRHLYRGPEVRVRYWQVTGPYRDEQPNAARGLIFGEVDPGAKRVDRDVVESALRRVSARLFRREVNASEIEGYVEAVLRRLDGRTDFAGALRPVLKALLCSSEFLFLTEPIAESSGLTAMQRATRLSYFLTAGPPDEGLRKQANRGSLDASVIRTETDRLLDSPRGERFLRLFTEQWLGLNALGSMAPDKEVFPQYHIDRLESAMKEETWRVVAELFRSNQPVTALMEADFTYLNAGLSRLYGLPEMRGEELRRVVLPAGFPRRGLLGHASVLTVTANGVETSPVKRGVWLLEKIFGTPPSPPPPDVPPIEPDIRGATTIRQQLEKHRSVQVCADCHAKIDPLGFALEGYDPIGRARSTYPNGASMDTRGEYRGRSMEGPADIRAFLVEHPDRLSRNLAHRLMTYALGRTLGFGDEPAMRRLEADWQRGGYRLRELVQLVAASELMGRP